MTLPVPPPPPASQLEPEHSFVSRGGIKLRHALDAFGICPRGLTCADLGCNVGGFTDCLLQSGAAKVYAVDTGYGTLAWKLRQDPRVITMERANALHASPPEPVNLVVIDMGWTPQRLCIPAALRWLRDSPDARIISLIKPHYELDRAKPEAGDAILSDEAAVKTVEGVLQALPALGVTLRGIAASPIRGGASKKNKSGNAEWLACLVPVNR